MAIRCIYFDFGNVLCFFSHPLAARQMAALAGCDEQLAYKIVFEADLQNLYESGQITGDEFCRRFSAETQTAAATESLLLAAATIFEVNLAMKPLVAALQAAGHRTGILSNTCEAHWRLVTDGRFSMLADSFDPVILSYEVGAMKPAAKIYQAAIERAGCRPEEIFFTDDRSENVTAAHEAGIQASLFTTPSVLARELRQLGVQFNF